MTKIFSTLAIIVLLTACKNDTKETPEPMSDNTQPSEVIKIKEYPGSVAAVFEAHGGIDKWNQMNNLCFEMDGKNGDETHTISLKDRSTKIETKAWTMGNNGSDVWLLENEPGSYKGNARFYHNLMFYFYAMPFVVGDDGITYTQMPDTELKGTLYKAIKVGYQDNVGESPDDEYVLYLNSETNTMEWLGYTVTYGADKKSTDWHFVKYDKWEEVNGLLLPSKLTFYNTKDDKPTSEKSDKRFTKISITETKLEPSVFTKPKAATMVPR